MPNYFSNNLDDKVICIILDNEGQFDSFTKRSLAKELNLKVYFRLKL